MVDCDEYDDVDSDGNITILSDLHSLADIEKSSKDELVEAWKEIDGVTIKGFDRVTSFRAKKKERPALRVPKPEMSDKDKKVFQRRMLERKLKVRLIHR